MRIYAVVRTTAGDPRTPRLDEAWDEETARLNPAGLRQGLADTLLDGDTDRAALVVFEVDDADLLRELDRPALAVRGVLHEGDVSVVDALDQQIQ